MCGPREYCIVPGERVPLAAGCVSRLCLPGRTLIGKVPLACPYCHGSKTRRSKRRTALEYLFGLAGVLPWRCGECGARFYARAVPVRNHFYALRSDSLQFQIAANPAMRIKMIAN